MKSYFKILRKSALLFVTVLIGISSYGLDIKELEDSATKYYNKSDYNSALVYYDSIISLDYSSVALFLNAGNCYYQSDDLANAIYFYEKALTIDPSNEDVKHNLLIANLKIAGKTDELPQTFYVKWFQEITSVMSTDNWAILALVLFILSLGLTGLYLFSTNLSLRKTSFIVGIVCLSFSVFSVIFSLSQSNKINGNKFAIVFEKSLVKSSHSVDSNNLFEVPAGLKVEVADSLNGWYSIKLSDGKQGWIETKNIKRL